MTKICHYIVKMATSNTPRNITFTVAKLNIQLNTNVAGIQPFKRGMLKLPKMTDAPEMTSELPFFTTYVKYPSHIQNSDWKTRFEFFFNRDTFVETLRKEIENDPSIFKRPEDIEKKLHSDNAVSKEEPDKKLKSTKKQPAPPNKTNEEWLLATEKENIMITLRSIFPIPDIFGTALKNSYDHILMQTGNSRVIYDLDIKNAFNIFGFMYKFGIANKEEEDYFLNVNGKRYEIEDVVWENDIVNHPTYSDFLKAQNSTFEEVSNSKYAVVNNTKKYAEYLDTRLTTLNARSKLKDRYIFDIFKANSGPQMINEMKESCGNAIKSIGKDVECKIDGSKFNDRASFVKFFEAKFNRYDEKKFDKYIYADAKNQLYPNVKEELIREHYTIDDSEKIDVEKSWNTLIQQEGEDSPVGLIQVLLQDLKNPETITGLIYSLEMNRDAATKHSNPDRTERETKAVLERIIDKLNRLIGDESSRETGITAANTILSINQDVNDAAAARLVKLDDEYIAMFNKLVELAIQLKASSIVLDFVDKNKPMNLNQDNETSETESKTTKFTTAVKTNPDVIEFIRKNYTTEYNKNNQLSNSISNIYEPVRKTSNPKLYCLLRKIKTGNTVAECKYTKDFDKLDSSVFKKIYDYYVADNTNRTSFLEIEPYLYTGVDQIQSNNSDEKSNFAGASPEISVRIDLVEADKFEKVERAPCKLFDSVIAEEYKHLTDKRYNDGTILSTYRNLDFDSVIPNPMGDAATAAIEANPEETKDTDEPVTNGGKRKGVAGTRKTKIPCKTRTLRERRICTTY